jgi:hypothetical protein
MQFQSHFRSPREAIHMQHSSVCSSFADVEEDSRRTMVDVVGSGVDSVCCTKKSRVNGCNQMYYQDGKQ